jgi:putative salt-induced outer membrane protein YdiY
MILRIAIVAMLLLSTSSFAGQIFMLNGDVITGDIKKIWDDEVTIEPAYADEFNVDLDAVAHFESEREFDVEFADGREAVVALVGGGEGLQVIEVDGVTQEVPVMQLAELDEPEKDFDWDTNIDANSTVNTGNTDNAQGSLQFHTNLKVGDHRHIGDLTFARDETDGVTTKEQDRFSYAYNWSFRDPWFLALNLSAERDPIRNLERRLSVGGGVGYNIWDDAGRFFQVQAVAGYQDEEFTEQESNDSGVAGWILRFRYRLIDDLTIFHDHTGSTTISGRSNDVFQSSTGVRYEITDLLYFNLQFDFDHESNPADGVDKTDTTTLLGMGLEF